MSETTWKEKIPLTSFNPVTGEIIDHTAEQTPPALLQEPAQVSDQFGQLIALVDRLISNPELDLDRVERMLGMAQELRAQRAEAEYTAAFAAMQNDIPIIDEHGGIKDKAGRVQSTYAYYEDIMEAVKPVMSAHGLALNFPKIGTDANGVNVTATLKHIGGHKEVLELSLPLDDAFGKNHIQRYASATTYAKRYAAIMILNITTRQARQDDDDGNSTQDSAEYSKAISEIDMFMSLDEGLEWKEKRAGEVRGLISAEEDKRVVAAWNNKMKRLSEKAYGQGENNG